MRIERTFAALTLTALFGLLGCDWYPGSTMSWGQTVRTWEPLLGGDCLAVGSYVFQQDATMPPFDLKASIGMRTENKDDQEFLPQFVDLRYELNDVFYFQIPFELKKGKGKQKFGQPSFWNFLEDDELDVEICASGGDIPIHTMIDLGLDLKFWKNN